MIFTKEYVVVVEDGNTNLHIEFDTIPSMKNWLRVMGYQPVPQGTTIRVYKNFHVKGVTY